MPIDSRYVDNGKGVHRRAHGVVTSADIIATAMLQSQDVENAKKLKYILYDFTDVTEANLSREGLMQVVEHNRRTGVYSPGILATIIAPNPLLFGLARMWQSFANDIDWRARVFDNRADAVAWLRDQLGHGDPNSRELEDYPSLR